jgi:hypothetical protein
MKTTLEMAREAGFDVMRLHGVLPHVPEAILIANVCVTEEVEHLVALVRADERAASVQDENQAFIDSLPTDSDDKMYMQIHHWARQSYARHKSLVAGQMITAGDASDTHIIWATLRWAKENTPPAAPVPLTEPELRAVLKKTNHMITNTMCGPFWPELEQACRAIEAAHGITKGQK